MHGQFAREVGSYNKNTASALLTAKAYPKLFEEMRTSDSSLYYSYLVDAFAYRQPTPVYRRLLLALDQVAPTGILTTNVDESLEHHLPGRETIQRSDVERMRQLLAAGETFTAKLHGSISAVETTVFSERDYEEVQADVSFLDALRSVLAGSTVLFLGYGLQDGHVVSALQHCAATHALFGTGGQFIVMPAGSSDAPPGVRRISYLADPPDHRSALLALEVIAEMRNRPNSTSWAAGSADVEEQNAESICFIADLLPPGTVTTSQTLVAKSESETREVVIGAGYVDGEVVLHDYSALHDVVVGLVSFDVICLSIDHLGQLHNLLGPTWFWAFVETGAIRLVNPPPEPAVVFPEPGAIVGDIKALTVGAKTSSAESFQERTIAERIRRQMKPIPGKEDAAERQMDMLGSSIVDIAHALGQ